MRPLPLILLAGLASCGPLPAPGSSSSTASGAPVIDRFGHRAGLLRRADTTDLPAPGAAIDLDRPPFLNQGLGPDGKPVRYYHFDVQSRVPAPRYRVVREGSREPLEGQQDLVDLLPQDRGYSDFWRLHFVEVPEGFAAGTFTSVAQVLASGLKVTADDFASNCPIVPAGSRARAVDVTRRRLLYRGSEIECLELGAPLLLEQGMVPTSPIYVTFRLDPAAPGGGPPSGFRTEPGTAQTHNVLFSLPGDLDYSPLWDVHIYANVDFPAVRDAESARQARVVAKGPLVNCPVVQAEP